MVLKRHNIDVNTKRIQKIMRNVGLIAKGAGKRYHKFAKRKYEAKENILNRVFKTDKKNIVWVGDITYIPTRQGFLYLSVFIDIFSRKVTGWSMSKRINQNLVITTLNQAIGRERPKAGLIIHTDRGSQYTSKAFEKELLFHGFKHSMSGKGNPYDNAVMESFYRTLKRELIPDYVYDTREQAQMEIFKYIETYYNTKRIHSTLDFLSPIEYEIKYS